MGTLVGYAGPNGRVTVDNEPAVVAIIRQEWLADPEKIVAVLMIKRSEGIYAGMDEKAQAIVMKRGE